MFHLFMPVWTVCVISTKETSEQILAIAEVWFPSYAV